MDTYFIGYHEHTIIFLHYLLGNSMMLLTLIHIRIYVQSYPCLGSESKRHRGTQDPFLSNLVPSKRCLQIDQQKSAEDSIIQKHHSTPHIIILHIVIK